MLFYFAGAYARRAELAVYADELEAAGVGAAVYSRWLTDDQTGEDAGFSAEGLTDPATVARAWAFAVRDIDDLAMCEGIVSFTGEGERGGRHIEHGMALIHHIRGENNQRWSMRLVVVGPREHVFHCHPSTEVYADFAEFLSHEINRGETKQ